MEVILRGEKVNNYNLNEVLSKPSEKNKELPDIKIGSLCSDCVNPVAKVSQAYIFDLENIIKLGMYEKACVATEVLMERYDDAVEIALNKVLPAVKASIYEYENRLKSKTELMKSLQAADISMDILADSAGEEWNSTECSRWKEILRKIVKDYCELLLP